MNKNITGKCPTLLFNVKMKEEGDERTSVMESRCVAISLREPVGTEVRSHVTIAKR